MSVQIGKNSVIKIDTFSEFLENTYDKTIYIEPDNSAWIKIVRHNNPANARFASSDPFISQVYKSADMWFNVALCNQISDTWELMVKQKTTSDATETKWRWIQTVNPMTATFDQTKAANVTKITTSGYTNTSYAGGAYYNNGSNTYLVINNSTNGNWHGALGCWTLYQGGIPGYPNTIVTTGYQDLYLRMDTHTNLMQTKFGNNFLTTNELNEIY